MPALKNQRHERFAQNLAKGQTVEDAYEKAGFRRHHGNCYRLRDNEGVQRRLAELQERAAERVEIDRSWVLKRLIANHDAAVAADDRAQANRALELLGKDIGMFVERREVDSTLKVFSDEPMTDEEWAEAYTESQAGSA